MNEEEIVINFINKKLGKYLLLTKLDKSFKYRIAGPYDHNNIQTFISNLNKWAIIKYTISGFKLGLIEIDRQLNIITDEDLVINENLSLNEKLQNISNYLDYVFKIENNYNFKKGDKNWMNEK